jgi:thiol-disulfide isomerase/thioredoxin
MRYKFFVISVLFLLSITAFSQVDTLRVRFIGKKYDKQKIHLNMEANESFRIIGSRLNETDWDFVLPDSARQKLNYMDFRIVDGDSAIYDIAFSFPLGGNKVVPIGSIQGYEAGERIICQYDTTVVYRDQPFAPDYTVYHDIFIVENPHFDFYAVRYAELYILTLPPEQRTDSMIELVKSHPSSLALLPMIRRGIGALFSYNDTKRIFSYFNDAAQESYQGRSIRNILSLLPTIPDIPLLKNLGNNQQERMITDSDKYNMVIFSASWCGWCHEQIPLLKQIYADLHDKGLEMIYITTDKEEDLKKWKSVMEEYAVPWRSLWGEKDPELITYKFGITAYPQAILFHPNGKSEKIDVRKEPEKEKLYGLLNGEDKS